MKNIFIAIFSIAISISTSAQVQVTNMTTPPGISASAILQVDATNKGVSLPNVALLSTTDVATIATPKDGLMVYNTNTIADVTPGYYYRYNNAWQPLGKITDSYIFQQKIDVAVLGYTPSNVGITVDNSTGSINQPSNGTWTKNGCVKWDASVGGNNHTYCAYTRSSDSEWEQAFSFAQFRGGYLVTITSDAERNWLKTNIIDAKSLSNNIWLGYNKYQSRYIPLEGNNNDTYNSVDYARYRYKWITGEKWAVNWEVPSGATVQNNFATSPSIGNSNRCAYIMTGGSRQWGDKACNDTAGINTQVILEFQDTY